MRTLSPALLAAQAAPDAEAIVTIRCKRRGTSSGDPLAWRPLFLHSAANLPYADPAVTAAASPCAEHRTMIRLLRSPAAHKVGVQRFNVLDWTGTGASWPQAAAGALTAAPTDIAALNYPEAGESTPGIVSNGPGFRVFWNDGGRACTAVSSTDGVTWANQGTVYNGSATYARLTNFCGVYTGSAWLAVFNAVTPGSGTSPGAWHIRGFQRTTGWTQWPQLPYAGIDWQVAGMRPGSPYEPQPCVYVYLTGLKQSAGLLGAYSVLACQRVLLNADGTFNAWDGAPQVVDRAGPSDSVNYTRARLGDAGGAYLFALQERAVKGYWFVSALFGLPGSLDMEEPVYLGDADVSVAASEYLHPLPCGRRAWLVGSGGLWASATTDAPANLSVRSYTPVAYTYTVAASGGGVLQVQLDRGLSGEAAPEGFATVAQPEVYVGDLLWLDRTLAATAGLPPAPQRGTQTLAFRVVQVAYGRDRLDVIAVDALGVLAHMRPRRPKVLAAGERTRMADVDAICRWCGLDVTGSATLPQNVWPSPGFTWAANESGLGALRRYLMDQVTALRSAGAEAGGQSHTAVQSLALPTASSYTYVSPAGLAAGLGQHEIAGWQLILDSRQPRLLIATGLAPARLLPGLRPYPLALVDYSYAASDSRLQSLAAAQAQWLLFALPLGWIEATANLGIELYDIITVDALEARVVAITETFHRGRLRQRLDLAEVNTSGASTA